MYERDKCLLDKSNDAKNFCIITNYNLLDASFIASAVASPLLLKRSQLAILPVSVSRTVTITDHSAHTVRLADTRHFLRLLTYVSCSLISHRTLVYNVN